MASPVIANFTPASAVAGGAGFTLTINGQNFDSAAAVYWGSTALTTTFVNSGQLTAAVTSGLIANPGVVQLTVLSLGIVSGTGGAPSIFAIPSPPNAIDLATLSQVKGYLYTVQGTPADDYVLQWLTTSASQYLLSQTHRASLNSVSTQTEPYNGTGQPQITTREFPITAVQSVVINGYSVPATPTTGPQAYLQPGWAIGLNGTSIVLSSGGTGSWYPGYGVPSVFPRGILNVVISYSAGYDGIPFDINEACVQLIGQNYKRRGWIDEASRAFAAGGGQTTYRNWDAPTQVRKVINDYSRRWGAGGA
jgi:hypothetical protein